MIGQLIRYNIIQCVAYAMDYLLFIALLHGAGMGAVPSNLCGKLVAGIVAFFCHKYWTFRHKESINIRREAVKYGLLLLVNMAASSLLLQGLVGLGMRAEMAKPLADILCMLVNFLLAKTVVFRPMAGRG